MKALELTAVGTNYSHPFPEGPEPFALWLEYRVSVDKGHRIYRIGFGRRPVYRRERCHVVVWDAAETLVEFNAADDFDVTGDVLSELKVQVEGSVRMSRYPEDAVPDRYSGLRVEGLVTRIAGARNAWAVVANIADHAAICSLAALRQLERS